MSSQSNDEIQLALLASRLLTGELDENDAEELLTLFKSDDSLRSTVADDLTTDFLLRQLSGTGSTFPETSTLREIVPDRVFDDSEAGAFSNVSRRILEQDERRVWKYRYSIVSLAALNLLFVAMIFLLVHSFYETEQIVEHRFVHSSMADVAADASLAVPMKKTVSDEIVERSSNAVAVIKTMSEVVWTHPNSDKYQTGDLLPPGWIRMRDGQLRIDFFSGASVVIEGECEFQILSHNLAFCKRGKAIAEVPEQAIGFRIDTPQMEVVDLGTSFVIDVSETGSAVRVLQGMVEIGGLSGGQLSLKSDDSVFIDGDGNVASSVPVDHSGLTTGTIKDIDRTMKQRQYEQWKKSGEYWNNDPSLLVRFDFENRNIHDRTILNVVGSERGGSRDGFLVDGRYSNGRWNEKEAVTFGKIPDRLRFSIDGEYEAVTLVASVCVNGFNQSYNSIFSTHGFSQGQVHWHLYHDGKVAVDINADDNQPPQKIVSDILVTPDMIGKWIQLAAVVDLSTNRVSIYLDGELKHVERFRMSKKLQFGRCELGNWSTYSLWYDEYPVRSFGGAIDEFHFFSRALSKEEIKSLSTMNIGNQTKFRTDSNSQTSLDSDLHFLPEAQ